MDLLCGKQGSRRVFLTCWPVWTSLSWEGICCKQEGEQSDWNPEIQSIPSSGREIESKAKARTLCLVLSKMENCAIDRKQGQNFMLRTVWLLERFKEG